LSQNLFFGERGLVPLADVRIESVGVNPLDQRRVDVAVDFTPCREPFTVRMAIVGPDDDEWSSTAVIQNREPMLDKVMHLRRDAQPGEYTLHIGVFQEDELITRAARAFVVALDGPV
jgi:hypothetical protein